MRKLAAIGAITTGMLGGSLVSHAATTDYPIEGIAAGGVESSCTNIVIAFNSSECSWAKTRQPSVPAWSGPTTGGAQYAFGSIGDDVTYRPQPGDDKQRTPVTGTLTIDDAGTPTDGSDDTIAGTLVLGEAARNVTTGNNDYALERWTSITHTMAATPVDSATANPGGGFTYVIASKGLPTPRILRTAANPAQCWPSDDVPGSLGTVGHWTGPATGTSRVGIEGSDVFGAPDGLGNSGASTTAVIAGWECVDDVVGDTDCTPPPNPLPPLECVDDIPGNETGIDCSGAPATRPATLLYNSIRGPGFDSVLFEIVTDGAGAITSGQAYWNRQYQINAGPPALNVTDENSGSYGLWIFTSPGGTLPTGEDPADPTNFPACANWGTGEAPDPAPVATNDSAQTTPNTPVVINVVANDTLSTDVDLADHTIAITQAATSGTCTADNTAKTVTYTGPTAGSDSCTYSLTDDNDDSDTATISITITASSGNGGGGSQIALPGGSSRLDLLTLGLLLAGLRFIRRRRFALR
jgi:hypothetical protein